MLRLRYILLLAMFKYPKDTHIHVYTRTCTKYILKVRNCWVDWLSNFISLRINTVPHEVIYFGLRNFNSVSIFLINYVGVECHCQREGAKIRKLGVQCQCRVLHPGGDLEIVKSLVSEPLWVTACGPPLPLLSLRRVISSLDSVPPQGILCAVVSVALFFLLSPPNHFPPHGGSVAPQFK